jgi:Glycosyl transferases group 1.
MESMAKTPVVSYNIRYGPSDMIEDGVNGFLIEKMT